MFHRNSLMILAALTAAKMAAQAAPGEPDLSFGGTGRVAVAPPTGGGSAYALAIQGDGKVVAVGDSGSGNGDFAVMRLLEGGGADPNFGSSGWVTAGVGSFDSAAGVAIQPDGKIVVAGCGLVNGDTRQLVAMRFMEGGGLDPDFGDGGRAVFGPPERFNEHVLGMAIDGKGRIVLVGSGRDGVLVARLTTGGQPDSGFGSQGIVQTEVARPQAEGRAVAIQPDGRIVVAGVHRLADNRTAPLVLRYLENGGLDLEFGTGGMVRIDSPGALNSLVVMGDGGLLSGGDAVGDFLVIRLLARGSFDPLFGSGGFTTLDASGQDRIAGLAVTGIGKIIFAGESTQGGRSYAFTGRLRSNGGLDTAFGGGGATYSQFGAEDRFRAVALTTDGRTVVAGSSRGTDGITRFALARHLADTSLHPLESWRLSRFGSAANRGTSADTADPDGDGVPNLLEYAFGLDPLSAASRSLPSPAFTNGSLAVTLKVPDPAKGVLIGVQGSQSLTTNSWEFLEGAAVGTDQRFALPAGQPLGWMRLMVVMNPDF